MSALSVSVHNLSKVVITPQARERVILSQVSLDVLPSSITALIGPSGAGKSTLLRCLNGVDQSTFGDISLYSTDDNQELIAQARKVVSYFSDIDKGFVSQNTTQLASPRHGAFQENPQLDDAKKYLSKLWRQKRDKVGMVFQSYTLMNQKTVMDNICLPIELSGKKVTENHRQKAYRLLKDVGLHEKANDYPAALSGGQRQRVAIARALMTDPGLLLCDELTSALDPKTTLEILDLLKRVNREYGVTIILVTHDMDVVKSVADHVCVMDKGKIVEQGSVVDVLIKPQHAVTKHLLAATTGGDLPVFLLERIHAEHRHQSDVVLKLIFTDTTSTQPIIANVASHFGIHFSIIAGSLDNIMDATGSHLYGHLWVSSPPDDAIDAAIQYMSSHQVGVETVGFISWK